MKVQIWMTESFKQTPVDVMEKYGGKTYNIVRRAGCQTMEDVVKRLSEIRLSKGYGSKTENIMTNAIVDTMISCLSKEQRLEWFLKLVEENEPEDLQGIADGFKEKMEGVA